MELEKKIVLPASPTEVWALLLDPQVMAKCVPGMESVEVVSPTEYRALIKVKISFITAKFKIRTLIVEQDEPRYLKTEGSGDDASAASSFKQTSQMFLEDLSEHETEMRVAVRVEVLGRLGTFGLNVMKTKADRMWDEFGANLKALILDQQRDGLAGAQNANNQEESFKSEEGEVPRKWWRAWKKA